MNIEAAIVLSIWALTMLIIGMFLDAYEAMHPEKERIETKPQKRNVALLLELQEIAARNQLNEKHRSFGEEDI